MWVSLPDVDVLDACSFNPKSISLKMSAKYGRAFGLTDSEGGDRSHCRRFQDSSRGVPLGQIRFSVVPLFGAAERR